MKEGRVKETANKKRLTHLLSFSKAAIHCFVKTLTNEFIYSTFEFFTLLMSSWKSWSHPDKCLFHTGDMQRMFLTVLF